MRLLKLLQNFSGTGVKRRIVPHKFPYNSVLISKAKFQIEFESQIKTSSRVLNKFILGIFGINSISQIPWLQKLHKITLEPFNAQFNLIWIFHNFISKHNIFNIFNSPEIKHIKSHLNYYCAHVM